MSNWWRLVWPQSDQQEVWLLENNLLSLRSPSCLSHKREKQRQTGASFSCIVKVNINMFFLTALKQNNFVFDSEWSFKTTLPLWPMLVAV